MYNINRQNVFNYKSTLYIAKKLETTQDENLNQVENYDTPKKYRFNVQAVNEDSEIREFGELANRMKVALITEKSKYIGKFYDFDKAYLETTPEGEIKNGANADYRIYSVRNQNTCIKIYLLKLVKED